MHRLVLLLLIIPFLAKGQISFTIEDSTSFNVQMSVPEPYPSVYFTLFSDDDSSTDTQDNTAESVFTKKCIEYVYAVADSVSIVQMSKTASYQSQELLTQTQIFTPSYAVTWAEQTGYHTLVRFVSQANTDRKERIIFFQEDDNGLAIPNLLNENVKYGRLIDQLSEAGIANLLSPHESQLAVVPEFREIFKPYPEAGVDLKKLTTLLFASSAALKTAFLQKLNQPID